MWRMQDGNRVFTDAEWETFAVGLDPIRFEIESDIQSASDETEVGIQVFDRLTAEQKLALLADVALALRDPAVKYPRHTAANEGAVAAVFASFADMLRMEVEENQKTELRELLLAAFTAGEDGPEELPKPTSKAWGEWEFLMERFEGRVLWDTDYDLGDYFLDLPPEEARERMAQMTIDPEYFLSTPDEPGEKGVIKARQTLAGLLGLAVPDDDGLYPVLIDLYHDLHVGPVTPEEIASWEGRPWIMTAGGPEPSWECPYQTWVSDFSPAVPRTRFEVSPAVPGGSYELPPELRVEQTSDGWVVRQGDDYWCGLVDNCWTDQQAGYATALTFPTEQDARAAYCQADELYGEVGQRRRAAEQRLGMTDDDDL